MRTFSGESDLAIDHFEKSLRLDPRATRLAFHLTGMGICHFFRRRFDGAAPFWKLRFKNCRTSSPAALSATPGWDA